MANEKLSIIVVTNPAHDIPTQYLDTWSQKIQEATERSSNIELIEIREQDVTKENLADLIKNKEPSFVVINGHGTDASVLGHGNQVLIKCDENEHLLKDKIVHALSCSSGKTLGPTCINVGTKAFIGYSEEFHFFHLNKSNKEEQLADELAKLFLDPAFEAILAIIEGQSVGEAFNRAQNLSLESMYFLLSSGSSQANSFASHIYHNMKYQVCLGDAKTTL